MRWMLRGQESRRRIFGWGGRREEKIYCDKMAYLVVSVSGEKEDVRDTGTGQ